MANKYFSFYLPDEKGYITFGEIPDDIVPDTEKIEWAPLIPNNENPWSVRMSSITIKHKRDKFVSSSLRHSV